MGLFNAIQDPRLNEALIRRLGMKQDAPAPQLAGEIQAGFDLLTPPAEMYYLMGSRLAWGAMAVAAVAAKNSGAEIFNPLNSGYVAVVQYIMASCTANQLMKLGNLGVGVASVGTSGKGYRDSRINGTPAMSILGNGDTPALSASQVSAVADALARTAVRFDGPWVLFPGSGILVQGNTVNQDLQASFSWIERPFLPSELG